MERVERQVYVGNDTGATYHPVIAWRSNRGPRTGPPNRVGECKRKAGKTWNKVEIVWEWSQSFEVSGIAHGPKSTTN